MSLVSGKSRLLKHPPRLCGSKLIFSSHPLRRKPQLIKTMSHTAGQNEERTVGHSAFLLGYRNKLTHIGPQNGRVKFSESSLSLSFAQRSVESTMLCIWILPCLPEFESKENWKLIFFAFSQGTGHKPN